MEILDLTQEKKTEGNMTRRSYLQAVGGAVAGLVVGGAIGYLAKPAEMVTQTVTQTETQTVTQTVTGAAPGWSSSATRVRPKNSAAP